MFRMTVCGTGLTLSDLRLESIDLLLKLFNMRTVTFPASLLVTSGTRSLLSLRDDQTEVANAAGFL